MTNSCFCYRFSIHKVSKIMFADIAKSTKGYFYLCRVIFTCVIITCVIITCVIITCVMITCVMITCVIMKKTLSIGTHILYIVLTSVLAISCLTNSCFCRFFIHKVTKIMFSDIAKGTKGYYYIYCVIITCVIITCVIFTCAIFTCAIFTCASFCLNSCLILVLLYQFIGSNINNYQCMIVS